MFWEKSNSSPTSWTPHTLTSLPEGLVVVVVVVVVVIVVIVIMAVCGCFSRSLPFGVL